MAVTEGNGFTHVPSHKLLTASGLAEHGAADGGKAAGASGSLLPEHVLGVRAVLTSKTR